MYAVSSNDPKLSHDSGTESAIGVGSGDFLASWSWFCDWRISEQLSNSGWIIGICQSVNLTGQYHHSEVLNRLLSASFEILKTKMPTNEKTNQQT
jgi:hypothetical protein